MRNDVTKLNVTELWFKGWSSAKIARHMQCHPSTVESRLKFARNKFANLPWEKRELNVDNSHLLDNN